MTALSLNPTDRRTKLQHAIEDVAAAWGLPKAPIHPDAAKALKKAAEWDIYTAETRYTNPLQDIIDADPKKWDTLFDEATADYTKTLMVEAADQKVRDGINAAAAVLLASPQQYDHLLKALPVDEVEAAYFDALERLGDTAADLNKAVRRDGAAAQTLGEATEKFEALLKFAFTYFPQSVHHTAILVNTPDLFTLESWRGYAGNQARANYDQSDFDNHSRANTIKRDCAQGKHLDQLATGHWTNYTLQVARTHEELTRRAKALSIAGNTRQLDKGETPTQHRKGVGNTTAKLTYTEPTPEPNGWPETNIN